MSNRVYVFNEFSTQSKQLSARLLFPLKKGDIIKRYGYSEFPVNNKGQRRISAVKRQDTWYALPGNMDGIICFCSQEIKKEWTALEVTKIGTKGKCAFVRPIY